MLLISKLKCESLGPLPSAYINSVKTFGEWVPHPQAGQLQAWQEKVRYSNPSQRTQCRKYRLTRSAEEERCLSWSWDAAKHGEGSARMKAVQIQQGLQDQYKEVSWPANPPADPTHVHCTHTCGMRPTNTLSTHEHR